MKNSLKLLKCFWRNRISRLPSFQFLAQSLRSDITALAFHRHGLDLSPTLGIKWDEFVYHLLLVISTKITTSTLHQRRQWLTERLFNEIKDNSLHKLHGLLPPRNLSTVALRKKRAFNVPLCRTNRLMNSFIMHNAAIF